MSLLGVLIPGWVWAVALVICTVSFLFKGCAHRQTLLAAAAATSAGKSEQDALRNWTISGVGMAALLGGILAVIVLPRSFGLAALPAGVVACWVCVLLIRRNA